MTNELEQSFSNTVEQRIKAFILSGQAVAQCNIYHVNEARAIGLIIKEWSKEQFTLTFYEKHCKHLGFEYEWLKRFVRIAARLPKPATTMDEARGVMQLDFQTAGIMSIPESIAPEASLKTPFVMLCNRVGHVRELFRKMDDVNPEDVKAQLKPIVDYYNSL